VKLCALAARVLRWQSFFLISISSVKSKHAEGDIKQNKCVKKLNLENIVEKLEIYAPKGGIW